MLKAALTTICVLTLMATAYLSVSLVLLNPPRANMRLWLMFAAIFTTQSVLTLVAMKMHFPPRRLRTVVAAGACALIGMAVWRVRATLMSPHFEGYNLLLGAILVVQSALTLVPARRSQ